MRIIICLLMVLLIQKISFAQHKQLPAVRTTAIIKINGNIDEAAWKAATPAKDFIEQRPNAGKPEDKNNRTEIYLLYDNTSIYVGGYCYETRGKRQFSI